MNTLLGEGDGKVEGVCVTTANVVAAPAISLPPLQSFDELEIPAAFRAAAENEITAGEKILWVGRPSRNPRVHPRKTVLVVVGLAAIAVAFCVAATTLFLHGLKEPFPLVFAGVLGLIGLAFQLVLLADPSKTCRSCYLVTNRRAIFLEISPLTRSPHAKSYLPHQLVGLERCDHPEVLGAGDLIFEYIFALPGNTFDQKGFLLHQGGVVGRTDKPQRVPCGFFLLDQVREVEHLIRTTLLATLEKTLGEPAPAPSAQLVPETRPEPG